MKRFLKICLKILLIILVIILVLGLIIFAIRSYNLSKAKTFYQEELASAQEFTQNERALENKSNTDIEKELPAEASAPQNVLDIDAYPMQSPGLIIKHLEEASLIGFLMQPDKDSKDAPQDHKKGVVVLFGGSEGSPAFEQARRIAQQGYTCLALFFFGPSNQQPSLLRVPLEQLKEVHDYIVKQGFDGPITMMGSSMGAEYVAAGAAHYPDIADNIILDKPFSHYTFALDFSQGEAPAFSFEGKDIASLSTRNASVSAGLSTLSGFLLATPLSYKDTYSSALERDPDPDSKRIAIEHFKGNILLIAGDQDKMWDSQASALLMKEHAPWAQLKVFEGAGHIFAPFSQLVSGSLVIQTGGSPQANMKANKEYYELIDASLAQWHK